MCTVTIILALFLFRQDSGFPDSRLAMPVIATGLLLALGVNQKLNLLLSSRISSYIGDRSYSIYLWHWPFIVLSSYLFPGAEFALLISVGLGIICAIVTYRYIENPIRKNPESGFRQIVPLVASFLIVPLFLASSVGYLAKNVYFPKYESGLIQGNYQGDIGAIGFEAFVKANNSQCRNEAESPSLEECDADVVVLGDSHADHLVPGFVKNYPELAVVDFGSLIVGNMKSLEQDRIKSQLLQNKKIKIVVINKYWAHSEFPSTLGSTVKEITNSGKRVVLLDDSPNFPFDAFTCKYGKSIFIHSANCEMSKGKFTRQLSMYQPQLAEIVKKNQMASLFESSNIFCGQKLCSMVKNGVLNYLDLNHLNANGSSLVTRLLVERDQTFCSLLSPKLGKACSN